MRRGPNLNNGLLAEPSHGRSSVDGASRPRRCGGCPENVEDEEGALLGLQPPRPPSGEDEEEPEDNEDDGEDDAEEDER